MEEDNIIEETIDFSEELYQKNIADNGLCIEYEAGEELDANN